MTPPRGRPKFRRSGGTRVSARIVAMLQMTGSTMFLHHMEREGAPLLYISHIPKNSVINLSIMTHPELVAYRDFINMACSLGSVITKTLDVEASENYEDGFRDNYRLYRQLPILAVRRGVFPEHFEELQKRPFPVPNLDGDIRPDPIGLAGNGMQRTVVAPRERPGVVDPHPEAEADGTEELGEVGG